MNPYRSLVRQKRWGISIALILAATGQGIAGPLYGTVVDPRGNPLPGIVVDLAGERDEVSEERAHIDRGVTDGNGRFRLAGSGESAQMLVLQGPHGIGRVRYRDPMGRPVSLTYPVETTIILLHDNDQHFNFNHWDRFRAEIERIRRSHANVFLLNAGDIFVARPDRWNEPNMMFYREHALRAVRLLNEAGYDAMTVGNHEIFPIGTLTREALSGARFPLLGANIEITTEQLPQLKPYTVLRTDNDISLFVLGLSTVNFQIPGVSAHPCVLETTRDHLEIARQHDLFVALTHIAYREDRRLAEAIGDLDAIIGGHCHTVLCPAEIVNGVLIAQAGGSPHSVDPELPKYLGKIRIVMENDRVIRMSGRVITFDSGESPPGRGPECDG